MHARSSRRQRHVQPIVHNHPRAASRSDSLPRQPEQFPPRQILLAYLHPIHASRNRRANSPEHTRAALALCERFPVGHITNNRVLKCG